MTIIIKNANGTADTIPDAMKFDTPMAKEEFKLSLAKLAKEAEERFTESGEEEDRLAFIEAKANIMRFSLLGYIKMMPTKKGR